VAIYGFSTIYRIWHHLNFEVMPDPHYDTAIIANLFTSDHWKNILHSMQLVTQSSVA